MSDYNAIDVDTDDIDPDFDGVVEIYAELSKKQFNQIISGEVGVEIPYGSSMKHKTGSRGLVFRCEGCSVARELEQGLDDSGIAWQENLSEVDYEKIISRNRRNS